jgi:hypothetical protein
MFLSFPVSLYVPALTFEAGERDARKDIDNAGGK